MPPAPAHAALAPVNVPGMCRELGSGSAAAELVQERFPSLQPGDALNPRSAASDPITDLAFGSLRLRWFHDQAVNNPDSRLLTRKVGRAFHTFVQARG